MSVARSAPLSDVDVLSGRRIRASFVVERGPADLGPDRTLRFEVVESEAGWLVEPIGPHALPVMGTLRLED